MTTTELTQKEKRAKIAAVCGWVEFPYPGYKGGIMLPYKWSRSAAEHAMELPDYFHDLTAMHEAEKVLTKEQRRGDTGYLRHLWDICAGSDGGSTWDIAHATAEQRAEAFGKTLGLW